MSRESFREHYGRNKKTRGRINAAILAECPGGAELLDLLELVSSMRTRTPEESKKLTVIEDRMQGIRNAMLADVARRWEIDDLPETD